MNKVITNKAGNLVLELKQDTMSAWLTIKRSGRLIDEADILSLIDEAGIKTGFEEAIKYIRENSLEKEFDVPFPIAICNLSESESVLRYHFNPDLQINFAQGINFAELSKISYVENGSVLADYSSNLFAQGGSIYDIFGELIQHSNVDLELAESLSGVNVRFDPQGQEFVATKTGYPYLDELGRICVLDTLVIKGEDIPGETEITSPLDIIVQGSIACVKLSCGGNLHVKGDLHTCVVHAQNDLYVEGEIVVCKLPGIRAFGNISCAGMRDSVVLCKGNVSFSGRIENCLIACDGDIIGLHDDSIIVEGAVQAGGSISLAEAGSADGASTELEIAISPFYRSYLMQLTREMVRLKEDPEPNAEQIVALQQVIKKGELELDDKLNSFLQRNPQDKKSIVIHRNVFPPISIRVLKHSYEIKTHQPGLEILEKE